MSRAHLHRCDRCDHPYACHGEYIRKDIGITLVCEHYDIYPKYHPFRLCEGCAVSQPKEQSA